MLYSMISSSASTSGRTSPVPASSSPSSSNAGRLLRVASPRLRVYWGVTPPGEEVNRFFEARISVVSRRPLSDAWRHAA